MSLIEAATSLRFGGMCGIINKMVLGRIIK